ncbi:MAG: C2H2-type zinc finger protein, partial [Candidatus Babeliales bacterium]
MKTTFTNLTLLLLICATSMSSAMEEAIGELPTLSDTSATQAATAQKSVRVTRGIKRKFDGDKKTNVKKEKAHVCDTCGEVFAYKSHLVRHARTHT